jgi:two-component system, NtrC family, sensor kinase
MTTELDARQSNPYHQLRGQMLVVLLFFGLIPLVAMGAAGFIANQEGVEERMRNVLEAMVKNRKATVDLFLEEKLRDLELAAAALTVSEMTKPGTLDTLLEAMRRERGAIIDLGLIDRQGKHIAYSGPYNLQNQDYSRQPWFEQVMVLGRHESDVFLGFRRFPHMVMAVKKREAGVDYVLRATIDTDLLSALVREGGMESGADVFVLNRAGEYQTRYSDEHRLMEKADLGAVPLHSGVRISEVATGSARQFVATTWLRGDAWVLVARQEIPRFFTLLWAHPIVVVVFLAGLLLIPPMSIMIARKRLRQIRALEGERGALYESVAQSQKMALIGRMAATIAHEVNNPLAIIEAQVGVLTDSIADGAAGVAPADLSGRLQKIQQQVARGKKVTHRLLGFSRRIGPDVEPVDIRAALEEAVGFVEKEVEASRIKVVREYCADLPVIRSSLAQMQQVFLNLINNAVDAIGADGEIRLVTARSGEGVEVRVCDNGPGIAPEHLAEIFEPFYSTKAARPNHSGLGLAICSEAMRNLGGRIEVASELGRGTTFTLWFPKEVGDGGIESPSRGR